jgi:hypothetical protein
VDRLSYALVVALALLVSLVKLLDSGVLVFDFEKDLTLQISNLALKLHNFLF